MPAILTWRGSGAAVGLCKTTSGFPRVRMLEGDALGRGDDAACGRGASVRNWGACPLMVPDGDGGKGTSERNRGAFGWRWPATNSAAFCWPACACWRWAGDWRNERDWSESGPE